MSSASTSVIPRYADHGASPKVPAPFSLAAGFARQQLVMGETLPFR